MVFEDRILVNPRLLRLKNPQTNEVIDWEIQDYEQEEIVQEGTEINAQVMNELNNQFNYSEEEQIVGTWIGGEPIYRKIFYIASLPNNNTLLILTEMSRIKCVKIYGIMQGSNNLFAKPIPFVSLTDGNGIDVNMNAAGNIAVRTNADFSNNKAYVIIEYIKTTN